MNVSMIASLTLAVACATSAAAAPMFRGDAAHSGVSTGKAPHAFHRVKWQFPTGARIVSSPVMQDGVVWFGSDDGNIYAVDAGTGRQLWAHQTGGPVAATPAIANGLLYVGSGDGKFYALNAKTGATKWKFATAGERHFEAPGIHGLQPKAQMIPDSYDVYGSSPVVAGGSVFFGSGDHNIYALDAVSGELRWKFATGDVVHASPALADGVVYAGSWDSYFYAIDAASGKEKWRFHGGEDALVHNQVGFQSSPAIADGIVYTGCRDSNLYAIDAATGKEKWHVNNNGSWVISSPAVVNGNVYFATSDSSLYQVVDALTGKPVLQQVDKSFIFSSPVVAGDIVLLGITNGSLQARDRTSGNVLWEFQTEGSKQNPGWVLTADRHLNNSLLFRTRSYEATVVAATRLQGVGAIFSTPLVGDGVVYVGSTDGNLYAIE
ncbi:MAG TPA: PQQ-binding-like beta-propeller repeat protein [Rudaea sp.]|jgi:outer membrane protein assembly factor BamB|uniref:outer membrane protein assembly factor BamB family protein n=1 Tax=Rudaea sp. TaxID=2136325 RepID=UPI002F9486B1